ncbi:MAG: radical SAM protein [Halanaerobiales bacterium]|nr:radical SAM protein [Halanaerobiales bacterium]
MDNSKQEKILLMLLPFWAPLNPPLGISCLKGYLQHHGYNVKALDLNHNSVLCETNYMYLQKLRQMVDQNKIGNLHMIGYDVLMNHMVTYINSTDETTLFELVQILIEKNFFTKISIQDVKILNNLVADFYVKLEEYLLELIDSYQPSIFGLSVYNSTFGPSLFAFKLIKERYPQIKTLFGGGIFAGHLTYGSENFHRFVEKTPYIDKIFVGESEQLFLRYLQGQLPHDQKVYTLSDINNEFLDLNNSSLPDFSDLEVDLYPQLASYASRSCPFKCSFCSETVLWGNYRKKPVKQVVDELCMLSEKYNSKLFMLGDSLLNSLASDLATEFISREREIYWDGYLRADPMVCKPENIQLWRNGGLYRARLGIESGSENVLNLMNKKITPEQIRAAISGLASAGIKTTTYWVVGHPGETEEDFQKTLDLLSELKDDIYEADWAPFFYYPSGQVSSESWGEIYGTSLLYPEEATEMLITQTWVLNTDPSREVIYERLNRIAKHCQQLDIPNPYSLEEIIAADERWKELHANAVPGFLDLV